MESVAVSRWISLKHSSVEGIRWVWWTILASTMNPKPNNHIGVLYVWTEMPVTIESIEQGEGTRTRKRWWKDWAGGTEMGELPDLRDLYACAMQPRRAYGYSVVLDGNLKGSKLIALHSFLKREGSMNLGLTWILTHKSVQANVAFKIYLLARPHRSPGSKW